MKLLTKVFDRIIDISAIAAAVLIVFTMLAVDVDIVWTFFFRGSILWVFEIATFCLLYITFLGTAWLLKIEGHVKVDIVFSKLKPRAQAIANIVTSVFGIIISLILFWWGIKVSCEHFQHGYYIRSMVNYPTGVLLSIIPFGSFLLFIQFLRTTYGSIRKLTEAPDKDQISK